MTTPPEDATSKPPIVVTTRPPDNPSTVAHARRVLALIDLTDLSDAPTTDAIGALCAAATTPFGNVAAVCVWPRFVAQCAAALAGTGVRVATVVNFPAGTDAVAEVAAATEQCIVDGADEIDVVIPYRRLLDGDHDAVVDVVAAVVAASGTAHVKAILETGELTDQHMVRVAADAAIDAGADFIKTSTGKTPVSATLDAATTMLTAIAQAGRSVGFKPSGGIRTVAEAVAYLDLADDIMGHDWATPDTFRFGASSLLADVVRFLG